MYDFGNNFSEKRNKLATVLTYKQPFVQLTHTIAKNRHFGKLGTDFQKLGLIHVFFRKKWNKFTILTQNTALPAAYKHDCNK
jgi:hypothetical protein